MQILEQKKEIRKKIKELKLSFDNIQLQYFSNIICNKITQNEHFISSKYIFLYNSLPYEVITDSLLQFRDQGKIIVLPVVVGEEMVLKEYIPSKLKKGYMNILEPVQDEIIDPKLIQLAIIPGIAFDSNCNRLGRGKGYYDRLLSKINCYKIGICFDFQIVENIPIESNDVKMDMVITDCNVYNYTQECPESCGNSQ